MSRFDKFIKFIKFLGLINLINLSNSYKYMFPSNTTIYYTKLFIKSRYSSYLPAYEDGTECYEMSAYKIQTPGNYPE